MSEPGGAERILQGEEDAQEGEAGSLTADPFAAALAINAVESGEPLDPVAASFLIEQTRLVKIQIKHFEHERVLAIDAALRKKFSDRMRLTLQAIATSIAVCAFLWLVVIIWGSVTSEAVVVEPFDTPPTLTASGLSGKIIAAEFLDKLQNLQAQTRGIRKAVRTSSAWASDIKVEVPETGVSLGELERILHQRLGRDTHIGGDLLLTPSGQYALTVRGDNVPAKVFSGDPKDLEQIVSNAAEYVYGRAQPHEYAVFLENARRFDDANQFLKDNFSLAKTDSERAELANAWGNALVIKGDHAASAEKYRLAISLDPPNWKARGNLINEERVAGDEERSWQDSRSFFKDAESRPADQRPELRLYVNPYESTWAWLRFVTCLQADAARNQGQGALANIDGPLIADAYYQLHDPQSARKFLATSNSGDVATQSEEYLARGYEAVSLGDLPSAIAALENFREVWRRDPAIRQDHNDSLCFLGLVLGLDGRLPEAEAAFSEAGPWARCAAYRGTVFHHAGNRAKADAIWAGGLRRAPDLPVIYVERGAAELTDGDVKRALLDAEAAHSRAPEWADPLKLWGDVLAREGKRGEATKKYDEALKFAPNWQELQISRDRALSSTISAGGSPRS